MSQTMRVERRPRAAWTTRLVQIVLVVVAAYVVGALAGLLNERLDEDARLTELAALPAAFPDQDDRYLPQVTLNGITSWMSHSDYECETGDSFGGDPQMWCAVAPDAGVEVAEVVVMYDDDTKVRSMKATCVRGPRTPDDYCRSLFASTAQHALPGRPKLQKQAKEWSRNNIRDDAATVIGGVQLKTELGEHTLEVTSQS